MTTKREALSEICFDGIKVSAIWEANSYNHISAVRLICNEIIHLFIVLNIKLKNTITQFRDIDNFWFVRCNGRGGGEQTGRLVGTSVGTAAAPALTGIPFVGWLAAGWVAMFGGNQGADIGGNMAADFADACEE